LIQVSSDIYIAFLDGLVGQTLNAIEFFSVHFKWFEEIFWASETSISDGDDFTVRQFVGLV